MTIKNLPTKQLGVLYLTKSYLYFSGTVNKQMYTAELQEQAIKDFELVDRDECISILTTFFEGNAIVPAKYLFVLGNDICFEKILNKSSATPEEIQQFNDSVPFERVLSHPIQSDKDTRLIGTNFEIIEIIIHILEDKGFVMTKIVPASLLRGYDLAQGMSIPVAGMLLKHVDGFQEFNLLAKEKTDEEKSSLQADFSTSSNSPVVLIILMLFILSVLVGAVMYSLGMLPSQKAPPPIIIPTPNQTSIKIAPTLLPTATPTPTPLSSDSARIKIAPIQFKLVANSASKKASQQVQKMLKTEGAKKIEISTQNNISSLETQIVFSKNITIDLRNYLIEKINLITPESKVRDTEDTTDEITILIKKI
ncbi:MAG: hypothetical protein WCO06_04955 [Candidatus Roizmanbacteria bacterium]